jgi:gas vesicle protein
MSAGKIVLGVLAGVAIGSVLGILFAPDKGSATRKKIVEKGGEYSDAVGNKFNQMVEGITGKLHSLNQEASQLVKGNRV